MPPHPEKTQRALSAKCGAGEPTPPEVVPGCEAALWGSSGLLQVEEEGEDAEWETGSLPWTTHPRKEWPMQLNGNLEQEAMNSNK